MMLGLMFDVMPDSLHVRGAHAKCPVPFLPFEIEPVFPQPARRVRFEHLHRFRKVHRGRQHDQQMGMIGGASGAQYANVVTLTDSNKIHRELFAQVVRDGILAQFGAEDAMDQ
jgi:hypothetical protein